MSYVLVALCAQHCDQHVGQSVHSVSTQFSLSFHSSIHFNIHICFRPSIHRSLYKKIRKIHSLGPSVRWAVVSIIPTFEPKKLLISDAVGPNVYSFWLAGDHVWDGILFDCSRLPRDDIVWRPSVFLPYRTQPNICASEM